MKLWYVCKWLCWLGLWLLCPWVACGQNASDKEVAAEFAPVFEQGLGDKPQYDYITKFDFDGDWRGDNNWENAEKAAGAMAYIYYSVSETATHYFIHYAVFHPRDYKGGDKKGAMLSDLLKQGAEILGERDPTGMLNQAALAHENDMEGCLVVVAKAGADLSAARVVYVETLAHNRFKKYVPASETKSEFDPVRLIDNHPRLYIEPKGHGIEAYREDATKRKTLTYEVGNKAERPSPRNTADNVLYELLPIATTLWPRAAKSPNQTYGTAHDYGTITVETANGEKKVKIGSLGAAFLGKEGAPNAARPPWGWFDSEEREQPLGQWFFDPARTVRRHFKLDEKFSAAYTRQPFLGISAETPQKTKPSEVKK